MQKITAVATEEARLDLLAAQASGASRSQAARWIEQGLCQVNGMARKKPAFKVSAGDALELTVPDAEETPVEKEDIPLEILYEDADLAVVVKPCGMVVHPAAGNESGTLVNALLFHMEDLSGIGGVKRPGIVHRLDKDTSGLLMVAKNDLAHQGLSDQLRARTMEKHYLAVVDGRMREPSGRVDQAHRPQHEGPQAHGRGPRRARGGDGVDAAGKPEKRGAAGCAYPDRAHASNPRAYAKPAPSRGRRSHLRTKKRREGAQTDAACLHAVLYPPQNGRAPVLYGAAAGGVYRGCAKVAGGPRRAAALQGRGPRMMGERSAPPRLRLKRGKPPRMQNALLIKERRTGPGKSLFFKMLNKMG